ncbi:MAG TPA: hypothetical protein VL137_13735 [Polyangiaceae bacterium]|nr:hypothetical protein [Polyangiaceae bacterium]
MEIRARILAIASVVGALTAASFAQAEPLNPTLSRLVVNPACQMGPNANGVPTYGTYNPGYLRAGGDPLTQTGVCQADNDAFTRLISQWAFVVAPTAMHSARTTGYGGFDFSLQGAFTKIDSGADYWLRGTQGSRDPSNGAASQQGSPPGILANYSIVARKSFGFGLETALNLGFIPSSSIITGGADVRMALLEGFRTGVLGVFPDIAAGGSVRTITGTTEFQLTVAGLDVQISKPLAIASSSVLTPWVGYQHLWIFGNSGLVDLTPATDALNYCGYAGQDIPGNPRASANDGQPICNGGSPLDFNNNVVFDQVRLNRDRMMFGLNYRYEMVSVGGQFITDLLAPAKAQKSGSPEANALAGTPRQWTIVGSLGVEF